MGDPNSQVCEQTLRRALEICARLGVPIADHNTEGPWVVITFLGIELNTRTMTVRLPDEKLFRLREEIRRWQGRYSCTKRELQSLVGQLHHSCCVVKPGRTFLRRMLDLLWLPSATEPHHHIRLNNGFRSDLQWWATFLPTWNGIVCCLRPQHQQPSHLMPQVPGAAGHFHRPGNGSNTNGLTHGKSWTSR